MASTAAEPLVNSNGIADAQPVRGGSSWTHSDFQSIEGETDDAAVNAGVPDASTAKRLMTGQMLRALLEDRFHLKTHRDTEELPMYALTEAKDGFKLKPMEHGYTQRVRRSLFRPPISLAPNPSAISSTTEEADVTEP